MADITYSLYARKATESDELQTLSINSQIKEMLDQAERDGVRVREIRRKSHSAIRCRGFMQSMLKQNDDAIKTTNVDIRDYAKHILLTGKREDKQAIMAGVTTTLYLKSKTIWTRKPPGQQTL